MKPPLAVHSLAIDLNQPGSYWHWSIFNISVANLVLIAVMVVIFGAALLLPFPKGHPAPADVAGEAGPPEPVDPETARMWTARVRRWTLNRWPP